MIQILSERCLKQCLMITWRMVRGKITYLVLVGFSSNLCCFCPFLWPQIVPVFKQGKTRDRHELARELKFMMNYGWFLLHKVKVMQVNQHKLSINFQVVHGSLCWFMSGHISRNTISAHSKYLQNCNTTTWKATEGVSGGGPH